MGFPVGYSELLLPKFLLQIIIILSFLRRSISSVLGAMGLSELVVDYDVPWEADLLPHAPELCCSVSAALIQDILPAARFEDLPAREGEADACAVCLCEMQPWEEVRPLSNCCHVFHSSCLDRWMQHQQRTCPLCRTPLIPEELRVAFDFRMLAAADLPATEAAADFLFTPVLS